MRKQLTTTLIAAALLSTAAVNTANAFDQGDWLVRGGVSVVNPKSDNGDVVDVKSGTSFTINFSYMMTEAWSLELLAAYPFKHDINLKDGPKVGSTKQLPPTLQCAISLGAQFQIPALFGCWRELHRFLQ